MEIVNQVLTFLQSPAGAGVLGGLFLISEALASIPALKANSVLQLIMNILQKFAPQPKV